MLTLADHLLAVLIVAGLPLRAWTGMRALRAAPAAELPALRRRMWWRAIAMQWGLTAIVLAVWLRHYRSLITLGLGLEPTAGLAGVLVGLTTIVSLVVRQRGAIARDETLRARARERLAPVERLMPHAAGEYPLFAVLACTAGLCEEFLFRGWLLWYTAHFVPFLVACLLQALVFGVAHFYQGARGVLLTGLAGAFFTGVLLVSGSLWPAMLIHALMDLHAGDMARRVFPPDGAPEAGRA
jgi:membrane protease YdiL (CAAX protease family)